MGDVILLSNLSRPRRLIELSNATQMESRTLAEKSRCMHRSAPVSDGNPAPTLAPYGGEFIDRGRPLERFMETWEPDFYALGAIRFESDEHAQQWCHSRDY